jgi:uncharacterized protein (DUF433 family)
MGGIPCIRGLRTPVATGVEMIAEGMIEEGILRPIQISSLKISKKLCGMLLKRCENGNSHW